MGQALYSADPVFRDVLDECDRAIAEMLGWSVVQLILARDTQDLLRDPTLVQPTVTSLQIALTELLRSRGVVPVAVTGLSMGEAAAAYAAGILDLKGAAQVVAGEAKLTMQEIRPGGMLAVRLGRTEVERFLSATHLEIYIGCELSPRMTVLAGESEALAKIASLLASHGVFVQGIDLGFAFHTTELAPLETQFKKYLTDLPRRTGLLPFYSSVTGVRESGSVLGDSAYWWKILSCLARFDGVIRSLIQDGYGYFVEVGPHPTLSNSIQEIAKSLDKTVQVRSTLFRGEDRLKRIRAKT